MSKTGELLAATKMIPAQTSLDVMQGVKVRRTAGGIPVLRLHYEAHPERSDPEWKAVERRKYTSQASWNREQEIQDDSGGGELVFAETLVKYWSKIVIADPLWVPDPKWRVEGGFDHGRTNETAMERCYIDYKGTIIFAGEYYVAGKEIWEHAPVIKTMADIRKVSVCYADPTIFDMTLQQSQRPGQAVERARSFNELYVEQGIELFSPFAMDRSDVSFAGRLMAHWANLDVREPSVKIVCRNFSERPQHGLHNWDCPNLLWELMRRRRVKLTAQQLLSRNLSEALVDRENHANDAAKYILMSHPEPTYKTALDRAAEAMQPLLEAGDLTSGMIRYQQMMGLAQDQSRPARLGRRRR